MPATEPAHSVNVALVQTQIHVFPSSKFHKKECPVFSPLNSPWHKLPHFFSFPESRVGQITLANAQIGIARQSIIYVK